MKQPNRLAGEQSPYLQQHASNPVNWFPWGPEALQRAHDLDLPVFLSIGYSTCHWCHVMERESFEDEEVAALMNEAFVSIKVDREERPDIDSIYMKACQLMTGSGGWPLTVVMTPGGEPFFTGTYFPKHSRPGRLGMTDLIPRIQSVWRQRRAEIVQSAEHAVDVLRDLSQVPPAGEPGAEDVQDAYDRLRSSYDPRFGGFGAAPKFPSPHTLMFVLRHWNRTGDPAALEMVDSTLRAMRRGGIFDQVGYGFHRYSTDSEWLVPHFEKMLYDQALHIMAYTEAFQATGEALFSRAAGETIEYVGRDLLDAGGAFYSAEDADSEGEEGKFYVWTEDELRGCLSGAEFDEVVARFNVAGGGNFRDEATGQLTGANILYLSGEAWLPAQDVAPDADLVLSGARSRLLAVRSQRVRPHLDDKILTDWNGLMIAALAKAHSALGVESYGLAATRAADFLLSKMRSDEGRLLHRYRAGEAGIPATAEDYAFLIWGLLELYASSVEPRWLRAALELSAELAHGFEDTAGGGVYLTAEDAEPLIVRPKETQDGALPSANSVTYHNLQRLFRLTGDPVHADRAGRLARGLSGFVASAPLGHVHFLAGVELAGSRVRELVVVGEPAAPDTEALLRVARQGFRPRLVWLLKSPGAAGRELEEMAPFTRELELRNGRATAYLCEDFACGLPVQEPDELRERLGSRGAP
ncbi:MAG: thioredoxin domain-containing protein [Gemmatimonadota bacterium]